MEYQRIIRGYYLATPVFLIVEKVLGIEIRISPFIHSPGWRLAYFLFCFGCMAAVMWKPGQTLVVGLFESSINIILLFVGAALSWMFPFTTVSEGNHEIILKNGPVSKGAIVNFLLTGSVWIICFRKNVSLIQRSNRRGA